MYGKCMLGTVLLCVFFGVFEFSIWTLIEGVPIYMATGFEAIYKARKITAKYHE